MTVKQNYYGFFFLLMHENAAVKELDNYFSVEKPQKVSKIGKKPPPINLNRAFEVQTVRKMNSAVLDWQENEFRQSAKQRINS